MATLIRKISTKTLGYTATEIKKLIAAAEKPVHLYNVAGKASGVRRGESANGPWCGFRGEFAAVKPDGEIYNAPQCFLAEPFSGMLEGKVESVDDNGEVKNATVEFAVEVWAKPADTNVGYEYELKPVVKMQDSGNLSHLLEQFDAPKQLETAEAQQSTGKAGKRGGKK